jgi:hypothetical protein
MELACPELVEWVPLKPGPAASGSRFQPRLSADRHSNHGFTVFPQPLRLVFRRRRFVLFELAIQRRLADPEQASGCDLVAARLAQCTENSLPLEFL